MKYTKLILDEKMIVPEPKIRLEFFLHAIVTGETCELVPKTVDEEYLYAIATGDTSRMGEIYPRTLVELYYDAILNNDISNLPTPRTRWEEFLRSAVTKEPCELEPETSLEIYLSQISSNGGFDYIVSTSTNSTIISLPNSVNGTIKSVEMDGNTLVNYCANGSEELTLNNEINAQGTNVRLTNTFDNGKVDVVCEGNTVKLEPPSSLICWLNSYDYSNGVINDKSSNSNYASLEGNVIKENNGVVADSIIIPNLTTLPTSFTIDIEVSLYELNTESILAKRNSSSDGLFIFYYEGSLCYDINGNKCRNITGVKLKPNTTYRITLVVDGTNSRMYLDGTLIYQATHDVLIDIEKPLNILCDTSGAIAQNYKREGHLKSLRIYEKALTLKEILDNVTYSLQSVGQDDINGHKIEILSNNKNLFTNINAEYDKILKEDGSYTIIDISDGTELTDFIKVKPNTTYMFSGKQALSSANVKRISLFDVNKNFIKQPFKVSNTTINFSYTFTTDSNTRYIRLSHYKNDTNVQIEEGTIKTTYVEPKSNKKEIQLSKPLRGLPNGVKDIFVKKNNTWFVERNCGGYTITGNENWKIRKNLDNNISFDCDSLPINSRTDFANCNSFMMCNLFHCNNFDESDKEFIMSRAVGDGWIISLNKTKLTTIDDVSGFLNWVQDNKVEIVYQLATPTYEKITDPQVITYLDRTHISTNSTISCNMQIKNSGHNAIIKPSTLYTVAFNTDQVGEVNISLGGAKTSTTNGVAIITTPSTLIDDSLMLYGKGIKASNVRLLEGNKTNYIPQYFEGMKSCFEDKLQDDGTYKMEILSRNKNLFTEENRIAGYIVFSTGTINSSTKSYVTDFIKINKNNEYTFSCSNYDGLERGIGFYTHNKEYIGGVKYVGSEWSCTFTTPEDVAFIRITHDVNATNFQLEPSSVPTTYVEPKSNSIQLQLNEPLRAIGDVKDRFVLRDGKLMIERNCWEVVLDGNTSEQWGLSGYTNDTILSAYWNDSFISTPNIISDRFPLNPNIANNTNINEGICYTPSPNTFRISILKTKLATQDIDGLRQWLQQNPTNVVYQLAEPTYEEVPTSQRLVCYENGTLIIDTNITPTHVEIEYPTEKQQLFKIK